MEDAISKTEKTDSEAPSPATTSSTASPTGTRSDEGSQSTFRQWLNRNPATKHAYRIGVGVVGFVVVVAGLIMIPFPGPGWLVVIAGLAILATEFEWAKRLLEFTKKHVKAWTSWVARQSVLVKILLAIGTAAFVYAIILVTLHIIGVPDWVPSWIPLWH